MGFKILEITVISATDLKRVNLIGKMDVYVVVWLSGEPRTKQKTPVKKDGGTCPFWNHTVRFIVDAAAPISGKWVLFQLKQQQTFGLDKDLGEVRVPLEDLTRDNEQGQVITYQVLRPSDNPEGDLSFSYRVVDAIIHQPAAAPVMAYPMPQAFSSSAAYPYPPPQTGYPYPLQQPTVYGYLQEQPPRPPRRNGGLGMRSAARLISGLLRGLLIGEMVSDSDQDDYSDGGAGNFDMDF